MTEGGKIYEKSPRFPGGPCLCDNKSSELEGSKFLRELLHAFLDSFNRLPARLAPSVEIVPELRLVHSGDALETGEREDAGVFLKEARGVEAELELRLCERPSDFREIVAHPFVAPLEVLNGFFHRGTLSDARVVETVILHVGGEPAVRDFDLDFYFLHESLPVVSFPPSTKVGISLLIRRRNSGKSSVFQGFRNKFESFKIERFRACENVVKVLRKVSYFPHSRDRNGTKMAENGRFLAV